MGSGYSAPSHWEEEVANVGWFSREEIEQLIKEDKFLPPHIEFYRDCLNYLDK